MQFKNKEAIAEVAGCPDIEKLPDRPRVVFEEAHGRTQEQSATQGSRRPRSRSRDSISSVRSRAQSTSGIPIEFRTLSFQISESKANSNKPPEKRPGGSDSANKDYFEQLDYHILSPENVCERFHVFQEQGLNENAAATRLQHDGKNEIPSPSEHFFRRIFFYVFGGFCSVLWIGVIIFFICWRPLGNPPQACKLPYAHSVYENPICDDILFHMYFVPR